MTADDSDLLYHYTDTAGLHGILGTPRELPVTVRPFRPDELTSCLYGTMWATDIRYLNDSQELRFGAGDLAAAIDAEAEGSGRQPKAAEMLRGIADDVRQGKFDLTWEGSTRTASRYVTCFCTRGDLLSQWRGYGSGGGYAIGFKRTHMGHFSTVDESLIKHEESYPYALTAQLAPPTPIVYDADAIADGFRGTARGLARVADRAADGDTEAIEDYPDIFRLVCAAQLASIKHSSFREEREHRVIVNDYGSKDLKFRPGSFGLLPYMELYFPLRVDDEPIVEEIIIGPGPHRTLRKQAVEMLLHSIGCPETRVELTEASYRI